MSTIPENKEGSSDVTLDRFNSEMAELIESEEDFLAVKCGPSSTAGFNELYTVLADITRKYGQVNVYEETKNWGSKAFFTQLYGIIPDLRRGSEFNINRYVLVTDSKWAKTTYYLHRIIKKLWPMSPNRMRLYAKENRSEAMKWAKEGTK